MWSKFGRGSQSPQIFFDFFVFVFCRTNAEADAVATLVQFLARSKRENGIVNISAQENGFINDNDEIQRYISQLLHRTGRSATEFKSSQIKVTPLPRDSDPLIAPSGYCNTV